MVQSSIRIWKNLKQLANNVWMYWNQPLNRFGFSLEWQKKAQMHHSVRRCINFVALTLIFSIILISLLWSLLMSDIDTFYQCLYLSWTESVLYFIRKILYFVLFVKCLHFISLFALYFVLKIVDYNKCEICIVMVVNRLQWQLLF